MKKILLLTVIAFLFVIGGCANKDSSNIFGYTFIGTKTESAGTNSKNKMDIYTFSGELNLENLKTFSSEKKEKFNDGIFYYMVMFDSLENATFPENPFTAEYGLEEIPQKHIKAMYIYNKLNGYSKLQYYEKNKWESSPKEIKI